MLVNRKRTAVVRNTYCRDWWDDISINIKDVKNSKKLHIFQKPIELFQRMIKSSSNENDIVLDCFMGSGTTAVACRKLNRHFIGFEIEKKYCDIANKRLENIPERLDKFF